MPDHDPRQLYREHISICLTKLKVIVEHGEHLLTANDERVLAIKLNELCDRFSSNKQ